MVFTDVGRSGLTTFFVGGSSYPQHCGIGTGSAAVLVTNTALATETLGSRVAYTSRDDTTLQQVAWIFDFNSTVMSGTTMSEFGLFHCGSVQSGTMFSREGFAGIEFDGSNELQIQLKIDVF